MAKQTTTMNTAVIMAMAQATITVAAMNHRIQYRMKCQSCGTKLHSSEAGYKKCIPCTDNPYKRG